MGPLENKRVGIVGLGLMGGALAMGLGELSPLSIAAYDRNEEVIADALDQGVISFGVSREEEIPGFLQELDLVFLCLYPRAVVDFMEKYRDDFKPGALITDITGVKTTVMEAIVPRLREDVDFIFGHPMAGSEKEGFGGADASIFVGRNYILIPRTENRPENIALLKEIIAGLGFTNIIETTAQIHDQKIAFTSQLCHVIAAALIDSEDDLSITDYEGGSFGDLTRIAMINAEMWSELFITNKDALISQLRKYGASLTAMAEMIEAENEAALVDRLNDVRHKRVIMEIERQNKKQGKGPKPAGDKA